VIARHEAGGGAPERSPRERNFDVMVPTFVHPACPDGYSQ
jgi:hypothetical protein